MSSLTLEYSTVAQDTYLRTVQARTTILDQLNDVRCDDAALEATGVSRAEVRQAFETLWRVASFYESLLWREANEERLSNDAIVEPLKRRLSGEPDPVPASDAVQAGERS